jgi:predicted nucleic acid-binding protein
MILVDTNVISELFKVEPTAAVASYLDRQAPDTIFTAAVCEAEIRYGIARMPGGRRRDELTTRIARFFDSGFPDQVLPFDHACAAAYGELRSAREAAGKPISTQDAMIAATALAYGVKAIVTCNTRDFIGCGVNLIDPWRRPDHGPGDCR